MSLRLDKSLCAHHRCSHLALPATTSRAIMGSDGVEPGAAADTVDDNDVSAIVPSPPRPLPYGAIAALMTVTCLLDTFVWPTAYAALAHSKHPEWFAPGTTDVRDIIKSNLGSFTTSTAFSGIDCPQIAQNMIAADVGYSFDTDQPHNLASVEWEPDAILELSILPNGPQHIFKDISLFAAESVRTFLANDKAHEFTRLRDLLLAPGNVGLSAPCHCRRCNGRLCSYPRAMCHIAGTPCTDFSSFGQMLTTNGHTIAHFLVWAAHRLLLLEDVVILENVTHFPVSLLETLFGAFYDIQSICICATLFGLAMRRPRRYSVMLLKRTVYLSQSLSLLPDCFARIRKGHSWADFLVAGQSEQKAELRWGLSRTKTRVALDGRSAFPKELWLQGLIESEHERRAGFLTEYGADRLVISLAQDPGYSPMQSGLEVLHCIICHCHILWSEMHGRWFSVRETLQAMGLPLTNETLRHSQRQRLLSNDGAKPVPVSSFNLSRPKFGLPNRTRLHTSMRAGNGMSIQCIGAVLEWILMFLCKRARPVATPARMSFVNSSSLAAFRKASETRSDRAEEERDAPDQLVPTCFSPSALSAGASSSTGTSGTPFKRSHSVDSNMSSLSFQSTATSAITRSDDVSVSATCSRSRRPSAYKMRRLQLLNVFGSAANLH